MKRIHQHLVKKYPWYAKWHNHPSHDIIHWMVFLTGVIFATILFIQSINTRVIASGQPTTFHYTGFRPVGFIPSKGVRTTVNVSKLGTGSANFKSVWVACWFDNGYWVQQGYGEGSGLGSPFSVYLYGRGVQGPGTDGSLPVTWVSPTNPAPSLNYGTRQSFHIINVLGTTKWRVGVDDYDIYEFDLGIDHCSQPELFIEENSSSTTKWPLLDFNPAIEILINGIWTPVANGYAQNANVGMEGKLQNTKLTHDQIRMGGKIPKMAGWGIQLF